MNRTEIQHEISKAGLKVTPQRIAVLEALMNLDNHPTVEDIVEHVKEHHPSVATGTVYKTLEVLKNKGLITKVITDREVMRYDADMHKHHHLYSPETGRIEDYDDNELTEIIEGYFRDKGIENFNIRDIKLYITGEFLDHQNNNNYKSKKQ
mgnify:CR=1 FL=1